MEKGNIIRFDVSKDFSFVRTLGSGGTGVTHLFYDSVTDMQFAIKRFTPVGGNDPVKTFNYFVDEIKILFNVYHPNIVRIFNYYLFNEQLTGYIQMEFIDGVPIDEFNFENQVLSKSTKGWTDIFIEALKAFRYLELQGILHRDIRASNIMIDKDYNVKIIDFGFGKILNNDIVNDSVFLNWPPTVHAEEVQKKENYNHSTEVYYLGKLFEKIFKNNKVDFKFNNTLEKMCKVERHERFTNFGEVLSSIDNDLFYQTDFTEDEVKIYDTFLTQILDSIVNFSENLNFVEQYNLILSNLRRFIGSNTIVEYIPNNSLLIKCFITNGFVFKNKKIIKSEVVISFYNMLDSLSEKKKEVVLSNLSNTLSSIHVEFAPDELPF